MKSEDIDLRSSLAKKPPKFEKRLNELNRNNGIGAFRLFKFASRTEEEQEMIDEALEEKMARWKYDPSEMKNAITEDLLKILIVH